MMRCSLCYPIFSDFLSCMYGQKLYVDMSCLMRRAGLLNRKLGVSVCRGCTKVTMINKFVCLCQSWIIFCALCEALYRERRTWGSWSVCSWTNMLRSGRREKKNNSRSNQRWQINSDCMSTNPTIEKVRLRPQYFSKREKIIPSFLRPDKFFSFVITRGGLIDVQNWLPSYCLVFESSIFTLGNSICRMHAFD
jgi:hypothetical protein